MQSLRPGDPAPVFTQRSPLNPAFQLDTIAGRYLVLCFFGSAGTASGKRVLDGFFQHPDRFDEDNAFFLGISTDPQDEAQARLPAPRRGFGFIWDGDQQVSGLYGVTPPPGSF